ncbi:hypothetical protein Gpo141_00013844, partial [Globisporangium polare]
PNLAVAANDQKMLETLYDLRKQPSGRRNWSLNFYTVQSIAIRYGNAEILECIRKLTLSEPHDRQWERNLVRLAIQRVDPNFKVLEWLLEHLPRGNDPLLERDVVLHAKRGDLATVQWLHGRQCVISQRAMDVAAVAGHLHVLHFLYQRSEERCSSAAADSASQKGLLDIVKFVVENQRNATENANVINAAARHSRMEVIKFLVENGLASHAPYVIDHAARRGDLDVVRYLHENYHSGGCTAHAMSHAASRGRLDIVKFLHENRTEGCSPDALSLAARNGHLNVVRFLHEKYALRCSIRVMDQAAGLAVVQFLYEHRWEGDALDAMREAAAFNRLEVFAYLFEKPGSREAVFSIVHHQVGWEINPRIVRFLQKHEEVSFLNQAVAKGCGRFVHFVVIHAIASRAELEDAKALAVQLELPKMEKFLTEAIEWHGDWLSSTFSYHSAFW